MLVCKQFEIQEVPWSINFRKRQLNVFVMKNGRNARSPSVDGYLTGRVFSPIFAAQILQLPPANQARVNGIQSPAKTNPARQVAIKSGRTTQQWDNIPHAS
jgi:hypothetical protein